MRDSRTKVKIKIETANNTSAIFFYWHNISTNHVCLIATLCAWQCSQPLLSQLKPSIDLKAFGKCNLWMLVWMCVFCSVSTHYKVPSNETQWNENGFSIKLHCKSLQVEVKQIRRARTLSRSIVRCHFFCAINIKFSKFVQRFMWASSFFDLFFVPIFILCVVFFSWLKYSISISHELFEYKYLFTKFVWIKQSIPFVFYISYERRRQKNKKMLSTFIIVVVSCPTPFLYRKPYNRILYCTDKNNKRIWLSCINIRKKYFHQPN